MTSVAGPAAATEDFTFDRLAGSDRIATATLIAEQYAGSSTVILVNGTNQSFADALSANYLAGVLDAPILLTRAAATPPEVLEQLESSAVERIVVVGGDSVVSDEQVEALATAGYEVDRVSGPDRFDTSAAVITAGGQAEGGLALVATGAHFADALAGGPLAYQGHPMALTRQDRIDVEVVEALQGAGVTSVYILGGEAVVAESVVTQLESAGITVVERLSGSDRSATSVAVAEKVIAEHGFTPEAVNVASGARRGFGADALSGGPLTGKMDRPLLITQDENLPRSLTTFLADNCGTVAEGLIFGGTAVVSAVAARLMREAAQSCPADDVTAPVLSGASASAEGDTVTASVTAADDVAVEGVEAILLDGEGAAVETVDATAGDAGAFSAEFTSVADGTYTVRFTATDTSGNTATVATGEVVVDTVAPTLSGATAVVEGGTVTASATVTDNISVSGVRAALLDSAGATVTEVDATSTGDVYTAPFTGVATGSYTVRFTATDTTGNSGTATTDPVDVDVTDPVVTGATASVADDTVTASATATDNAAVTGVRASLRTSNNALIANVAATAGEDGLYSAEFTGVANGTYMVVFTATDTSGNTGTATTNQVEVDTTLELEEPYTADDGLTVTLHSLTMTEDDGDGFVYTLSYTFFNGTDAAITPGPWKAYDLDDADKSEVQSGDLSPVLPGQTVSGTYTFEEDDEGVLFDVVAYHSDQEDEDTPPSDALVWRVPTAV